MNEENKQGVLTLTERTRVGGLYLLSIRLLNTSKYFKGILIFVPININKASWKHNCQAEVDLLSSTFFIPCSTFLNSISP